ncbi:MAG TPA: hypothetical protein VKP58_03450 [Candidatus Acidoferrum sp.]|nr:hypothetical protein [Candidatus Acidoferrum sp.]
MINRRRVVNLFPFLTIPLTALFLAFPADGQQQQPPDFASAVTLPSLSDSFQQPFAEQQPAPEKTAEQDQNKNQTGNKGTSKDRLGFVLPNFLTLENASNVPPLTAKQKFGVVARSSFDWSLYPWYGFLSGISQAENSEPGYGQGAQGYAKRYGAAWADGTLESFMTAAILPSLFRQDPRYFQKGKGGFWHRTGYAVSRIVVTRSDSGKNEFNVSEIFGSAISSGISTYSYHPHEDKTLRNTASVWGTQMSYDALSFFVKEFWPDIRRKLKKKNN